MGNEINFAWPVTTVCKYDLSAFENFLQQYGGFLKGKKIVIFGAGIRGTQYSLFLKRFGYRDILFTDNNMEKVGGRINEFPIIPADEVAGMKNEIVILVSLENGTAICRQLKEMGFEENRQFFYIDNHLYDAYEEKFCRRRRTDILLFGDCGMTDLSVWDKECTSLGEMLEQELGKERLKVLAIHAMGMRAYYTIFKAHCLHIYKPRGVVLMANLEVFTGKQHLLPRSQHAGLMERLDRAVGHKEPELEEYAQITKERFANFTNDYFTSSDKALKEMGQKTNEKMIMKLNYMFRMDMENECIVYLKKFIRFCREEEIKLLLFIPPVNYEYAQELWGDAFREKYEKNVNALAELAKESGTAMKDFSYFLPRSGFADVCTIDETLNWKGRRALADSLKEKIREEGMI